MNSITLTLLSFWAEIDPLIVLLAKITLLLIFGWCAHWLLSGANPRWRVLLWRSVAVGLLLAPLLHAFTPPVAISRSVPAISVDRESAATTSNAGSLLLTDSASTRSIEPEDAVHAHSPQFPLLETDASVSIRTMLISLWCAGFLFCLIRIAGGIWYVRRLVAQSEEVPEEVGREFQLVRKTILGNQSVAVRVSSRVTAPILSGIIHPTVLITEGLAGDSRRDHLPAVFSHELAHVKSRDLFWNLVVHLVASALWFHPLAWFTRSAHAASCEAVSDATAVDHVGDVKTYGSTLAQVALDATAPPVLSLAMARGGGISHRVLALERNVFSRDLSLRIASTAIACCLLFAAVVSGFKIVEADEPISKAGKSPAEERANVKLTPAEASVDKALKFLAKRQNQNGSFGSKTPAHAPAVTGIVGMAMLASGSKPGEGPYGSELQKAVDFVLNSVREDGVIGSNPLYVHAYALRFLAEAQIASESPKTKVAITKAVNVLVECQNDFDGWRYTPKSKDADTSASSCMLIALAKAREAGVKVPQETFDRGIKYLKSCQWDDGGFGYTSSNKATKGTGVPRSAAVLSALCLSNTNDEKTKAGFRYLVSNLNPTKTDSSHFYYGQFHLATAMRFASLEQFRSWHGPIVQQLLKTQTPEGNWVRQHYEAEYITAQACLALLARHDNE